MWRNDAMNPIEVFVKRMADKGISVKIGANSPWIYLEEVDGQRVEEKYLSKYFFTLAFSPKTIGEPVHFTDIGEIFKMIRKYKKDKK